MARRAIAALLACAAVDAFCPGGVPTRRGGRLPLQACAGRDAAAVPSTQTLPRADFTAGLLAAAAAAAGALARPARAGADTPAAARQLAPRFIDVSVDLGRDLVLNVRQPFGLNKERSEGGGDRQGTYVWPASADLAKFLTSEQGRRLVQGRRVLELGAGTAVSGLAAALAGAESVVFTDGSQEVLEVTTDTIKRNRPLVDLVRSAPPATSARAVAAPLASPVAFALPSSQLRPPLLVAERLRWGNEEDLASLLALPSGEQGFDVLLGAEITYLSASIGPLLDTVRSLLLSSASAKAGVTNRRQEKGTLNAINDRSTAINDRSTPLLAVAQMQLANAPLALLTFTPEVTVFDGGGVAELESKARNRGMRVTYLAPPANNPEPDSLLIALTMQ